jgi:hypothetical protein
MEPLKLAEESAPSVEMPKQATAQQGLTADELAAYDSALRNGGFNRDTIVEKPSQAKPGLIIGLGCLVTLLIAGVVFLIFILSVASNFSEGIVESPEAEDLVEQFIYLIEDKKPDEAKNLFGEEFRDDVADAQLKQFAEKIAKSEIVQLECSQIRIIEEEQRLKLFVAYDVYFMDPDEMETFEDYANQANVIALLFEDGEELKLESIAASDFSGGSVSVGKSSYDQLDDAMASIVTDKLKSANWGLPCSVLIILVIMVLIVGIIQAVAVWAIFERANQPGWAILVPFYNMWVWAEVGDRPGWVGLASYGVAFIPYVGELAQLGIWIYITIGVAKAFDRSVGFGLGLCFLPIVFYPILAFDG